MEGLMEGVEMAVDSPIIDLTEDVALPIQPEPVALPIQPEPVHLAPTPGRVIVHDPCLAIAPEPEEPPPGVPYTIGGVRLTFPVKAYPSQVAIMAKVIKGLQGAQNCLLESPTGSGKTLALLCSALAWQKDEKERVKQQLITYVNDKQLQYQEEVQRKQHRANPEVEPAAPRCQCQHNGVPVPAARDNHHGNEDISDEEDRAAFKPTPKKRKVSKGVVYEPDSDPEPPVPTSAPIVSDSCDCKCKGTVDPTPTVESCASPRKQPCGQNGTCEPGEDDDGRPRFPQIFYGTRTHKQIEQVVRELKKTAYYDVKMSILASREHMCIHPVGSTYKSKTEMCHDLLDPRQGAGCRFKSNSDNLNGHEVLSQYGCPEPWDIEDLVSLGRKLKACPYFTSRNLAKSAELIFCPYNYLVDPQIQESMQLDLSGDVVIFDEAHNIEDMAREAASLTVDCDDIKMAAEDCKMVASTGRLSATYLILEDFLVKLSGWIEAQDDKLINIEYDRSSFTLFGTDAIASFEHYGVGLNAFYEFKHATGSAVEDLTTRESKDGALANTLPAMKGTTKVICQGLCHVFGYMYDNEMAYREDYRVAIIKCVAKKPPQHHRQQPAGGDWVNMAARRSLVTGWDRKLNFWCQNPAVAMKKLRDKTRSIILTSGTLAPVDSFSSELGVNFPIQFEANHVITPAQVWIGSISHGPSNVCLNAQYKNAETYEFQDELGQLVLQVCRTIPFGVLCFFPSYKMLEKLQNRWRCTGLWDELERCKNVLSEPRRGDELERVMMEFNRSIADPSYVGSESSLPYLERDSVGLTGALLLAVHRGKVSEGIDFADNQARAVIAVGIPYPNFVDTKVVLKRKYNDLYSKTRGLLSGSRWYDIQAYRALNQALGRCIRHRNDWGAILLVDDRFSKGPYYTNGLSRWIRNLINHHSNYSAMSTSLQAFTKGRVQLSLQE